MTDSKTPKWVKEEAENVHYNLVLTRQANIDTISQALLSAYERGRKEGVEEAAKVADRRTIEPDPDEEDPYDEWEMGGRSSARFIATAIRQLLEVKKDIDTPPNTK